MKKTVSEVIAALKALEDAGKGKWHVHIMRIYDGVTVAADFDVFASDPSIDGQVVWLLQTAEHPPAWAVR